MPHVPTRRGEWNLSEKNMANLHGFESGFGDGGNNEMASAYLLRWGGAVAETNATLYTETAETFGAFAGLVGANGHTLYASWLAGFDPANAEDGEFEVYISVTNNIPYLSWKPDLGQASRKYTVYGTKSLSPQNWQPVEDMQSTSAKFFKVTISQP